MFHPSILLLLLSFFLCFPTFIGLQEINDNLINPVVSVHHKPSILLLKLSEIVHSGFLKFTGRRRQLKFQEVKDITGSSFEDNELKNSVEDEIPVLNRVKRLACWHTCLGPWKKRFPKSKTSDLKPQQKLLKDDDKVAKKRNTFSGESTNDLKDSSDTIVDDDQLKIEDKPKDAIKEKEAPENNVDSEGTLSEEESSSEEEEEKDSSSELSLQNEESDDEEEPGDGIDLEDDDEDEESSSLEETTTHSSVTITSTTSTTTTEPPSSLTSSTTTPTSTSTTTTATTIKPAQKKKERRPPHLWGNFGELHVIRKKNGENGKIKENPKRFHYIY